MAEATDAAKAIWDYPVCREYFTPIVKKEQIFLHFETVFDDLIKK